MEPTIVVHGGAWAVPDSLAEASVAGVKAAARDGFAILKIGGSALDAVELAERALEDDLAAFDAGCGAVLNTDGEVELDGKTLAAGAVSSVRNITHPVTLARAVMEKTDHIMLTDRGASQFAESIGITTVPTDALMTESERREWEHYKKYAVGVKELFNSQWGHDTVGAVALDHRGNLACVTSTGGIRNKMVGRVGDTSIIVSGGYDDDQSGAVSCTGHGESIMKVTLARLILFNMELGKLARDAVDVSLAYMGERVQGGGGAIAIAPSGDWAARFTTQRMVWATAKGESLFYGLDPQDMFEEKLSK
ncbi:isoaspartyl peptidase/L-asparaginase [Scleropages formosus]|uniref:isoaspartyl peptidase/L-asparaginase n=1 Tax=Scleropages formosus TaxID=113540 RepID=UPI0010FA9065|nr:isoaspartyl peptidase/L-asparaginase-like [Scleropages formosus]